MESDMATNRKSCLIFGAKQIVQVVSKQERFVRGKENMNKVVVLNENEKNGNLVIVLIDGLIQFVGYQNDPEFTKYRDFDFNETINAKNCCILPGFIDSHMHPIWEGDRVHEFILKVNGASYMEVHEAGGGINFTVEHTKNATEEQLYKSLIERLRVAMKVGTTFAECKTGYGLEWETEYKMLRVLTQANRENYEAKPGMSITYLAAHAIPKNSTAEKATKDIIENQIPKLDKLIKEGELDVHNIDVFCEEGVFDVGQSRNILEAGQVIGLQANFHGDELNPLNAVEMGVDIRAKGISHLEEITKEEIDLMSKPNTKTVGIILPTTAYLLRLKQPPVRQMIDSGCIIALGSDFNPNAYCYSMPLVMNLACINMRMSLNEALIASTINSAFALGVENSRGSIEVGKRGDFVIIEANRWEHIIYEIACHDTLIKFVMLNGEIVHSRVK